MSENVLKPKGNVWFTSDTHFRHKNIIKYCPKSRGQFKSPEEMDEAIVENWNSVVKPEDTVWHLGDVAFCGSDYLANIMGRLNGTKELIIGNHDHRKNLEPYFNRIRDYLELKYDDNTSLILMHFPIESWHRKHHNIVHLHGHTHATLDNRGLLRFDVGVDCWNMFPVHLDQITELVPQRLEEMEAIKAYRETIRDQAFADLYERAAKDPVE